MSKRVEVANPKPCDACPWRTANHGRRHPGSWYTKANRRRLWAKLRRGESMTCHPTDSNNPVPEGLPTVSDEVQTHECAGALILQSREAHIFSYMVEREELSYPDYKRERGSGHLTIGGVSEIVARFLGMPGAMPLPSLNLNEEVSHEPLPWVPDRWTDTDA